MLSDSNVLKALASAPCTPVLPLIAAARSPAVFTPAVARVVEKSDAKASKPLILTSLAAKLDELYVVFNSSLYLFLI